jgi:methyl-accepting chemotaxis protein
MKINSSIKGKMLFYILFISSLIYIIAVGYISYKLRSNALSDAKDKIDAMAMQYANETKANLNVDMDISRALAQTFETLLDKPRDEIISQTNEIIKNVLQKNPNFLSIWVSYELNTIRENYNKTHGRLRLTYYKSNGDIIYQEEILDTEDDFEKGAYYDVKENPHELVMNPYYYSYTGDTEEIYETSVGVPVMDGDQFAGLAGLDLTLERFQPVIEKIKPYERSYAFLIANNGTFVAHMNEKYLGTSINQFEDNKEEFNLLQKIQDGKTVSYTREGYEDQSKHYVSYAPIIIGNSITPWSFGLAVPLDVVMADAQEAFRNAIIVGLVGLILVAVVIWIIAHNISRPIKKTTNVLGDLAKGKIDENKKLKIRSKDEIGQMSNSVNTLIEGLNKTANFAREIGQGNLDKEFELLSNEDVLGNSLLEMRKSLKEAREIEEKRKEEEYKQNWATKGLAKFGDILRQSSENMEEFGYNVISNLVKYTETNQGGMFIINDEDKNDKHIEMLACYAYSRRKYVEKRIEMGEGLIGRCVLEQKPIYLTEIPEEYINITSGLGTAVPRSILIVPLIVNEEVFGAVELAGFKEIPDYVRKFVEDVGEDIASTIKSTKINIQTNKLLEQSQQQSEELASQEEEMRQNMEELQATQEEAARRSAEMEGLINALKQSNHVIEYDLNGKILEVNENYLKLFNMKKDDIVGLHHTDYKDLTKEELKNYDQFWKDLKEGKSKKETSVIKIGKKKYTFVETYTPIKDQHGNPEKVLKIATDITEAIGK